MNKTLRAAIARFVAGGFGAFCLVMFRGLPITPWSGDHYWWTGVIFVGAGGLASAIWNDDNLIRTFYFGLTFPMVLSALTR
jgi:hypothetical protein